MHSLRPGLLLIASILIAATSLNAQTPQSPREQVRVSRVIVDVRAVNGKGKTILGLGPEDFQVQVAGLPAAIESVDWVTASMPWRDPARLASPEQRRVLGDDGEEPIGRLIVLLFQRDLHSTRLKGLMKMRDLLAKFVRDLPPEDRVAVLVQEHDLKLYADFLSDRDELARILDGSIVKHQPPGTVEPSPFPSLLEYYDVDAADEADSVEDALLVLARALRNLRGSKTLLFAGWSMNRWDGATNVLGEAVGELLAGRVTMFSFDVTDADYHSLEAPMVQATHETGGFYVKTQVLAASAMNRVSHALDGHYEISFFKPDLDPGRHTVEITLRKRRGRTFHRTFYDD